MGLVAYPETSGLFLILNVFKLVLLSSVSLIWLQEGSNLYGDSISGARRINTAWKKGLYHASKVVVYSYCLYLSVCVEEGE